MTQPTICVGIVALPERLDLVRALLGDLAAQTVTPANVLLVLQKQASDRSGMAAALRTEFPSLSLVVLANPQASVTSGRNMLLDRCTEDVLVLMDDDARMVPEAVRRISVAFAERPDAAVLTFRARWTGGDVARDRYRNVGHERRTVRSVTDVAAIEMAVSMDATRELGVRFDERFGPGTRFGTGDEFIFVVDLMRRGGRVFFVPEDISSHPDESSGRRLDERILIAKGAIFRRVFGPAGLVAGWLFVLRRRGELRCSIAQAIRATTAGWRAVA